MDAETLEHAGLKYAVEGAVATITLHRPEVRNAQTPTMWRALAALGAEIPDDVRVVVLKGSGHSFSAGLDRAMLDPTNTSGEESVAGLLSLSDAELSATIDAYQQGFTFLRDPRFVSIAAVQGYAIGAGFQIALSCDLRVAADDAQFCMKESALGLVPFGAAALSGLVVLGLLRFRVGTGRAAAPGSSCEVPRPGGGGATCPTPVPPR